MHDTISTSGKNPKPKTTDSFPTLSDPFFDHGCTPSIHSPYWAFLCGIYKHFNPFSCQTQ